jgi:hypothetical protein
MVFVLACIARGVLFGASCLSAFKLLSWVFCWDHGFLSLCIVRALLIASLSMPRFGCTGRHQISNEWAGKGHTGITGRHAVHKKQRTTKTEMHRYKE